MKGDNRMELNYFRDKLFDLLNVFDRLQHLVTGKVPCSQLNTVGTKPVRQVFRNLAILFQWDSV